MSNNPNPDAHGWMNWTSNNNHQQTNEQRITELEKKFRTHQGIDFAAAGADYPHPSQKVRALIFFEGNGRLDPTGIQMIYGTDVDRGLFWVSEYTDSPTAGTDGMSLYGYLSGGTARTIIMQSIAASGTYARVTTVADSSNAYAQMTSAVANNRATLSFRASTNAVVNANLTMESNPGVEGVVIQPDGLTADPLSAQDGQLFWRSDTNRYRVRLGGTYYDLALGDVPTTMNKQPFAAKTTTYTTTNADGIISVDATSASFTVTLVTAVGNSGLTQTFKKINAANTVTLDANGSQTIDGVASIGLSRQWESVTLVSNGSNWLITGWY